MPGRVGPEHGPAAFVVRVASTAFVHRSFSLFWVWVCPRSHVCASTSSRSASAAQSVPVSSSIRRPPIAPRCRRVIPGCVRRARPRPVRVGRAPSTAPLIHGGGWCSVDRREGGSVRRSGSTGRSTRRVLLLAAGCRCHQPRSASRRKRTGITQLFQ